MRSSEHWGSAIEILCVDVSAKAGYFYNDLDVTLMRSSERWGNTMDILCVEVGTKAR
jgi:hypothetical protein